MVKGKKVRIRLKKHVIEQKPRMFVGKILDCTEDWVTVDGRGIAFVKGEPEPFAMDKEPRVLVIPRENIAHIRVLPDDFDMSDIRIKYRGRKVCVAVKGALYTCTEERADN